MRNCKSCKADCCNRGLDYKLPDCRGYIAGTNADHIRSMTDEELGSVLFGALGAIICPNGCDNCDGDCDRHTLDWLKQPYKDGD